MQSLRYEHGGNIYEMSNEYGGEQYRVLDFSANINPLGVPESIRKTITFNVENLANYPDPECRELRNGISEYLQVPANNIIAGNGASEIISLVLEAQRPGKILVPAPTFSEYSLAAEKFNIEIEYFELKEEDDFKLDIGHLMAGLPKEIEAVILCNPNNPTSQLVTKEDLLEFVAYAKKRNIFVIVDECFIELTEGSNLNSAVQYTDKYDNLFIIRAFTKLFAIPGLRLGYGIGSSNVVKKMWEKKMPWSVNMFSCCLGGVFKEEGEYLKRTALWLREEKQWLYEELCRLEQLKVFKPQTNFILMKILADGVTAEGLKTGLASRGILIRNASNFTFLNNRFFRIALKDRASNLRLVNELKSILAEE